MDGGKHKPSSPDESSSRFPSTLYSALGIAILFPTFLAHTRERTCDMVMNAMHTSHLAARHPDEHAQLQKTDAFFHACIIP
jgi:hypothetical protein